MRIYDHIVIGAGPAGCFAAAMLAKKGYDVCVLEKRSRDYVKVCGDGISVRATEVLRKTGFPLEKLVKAGAVRIDNIYEIRNGTHKQIDLRGNRLLAFALPRVKTDALFREYCAASGAEIIYDSGAAEIERQGDNYSVCGRTAREIVVAIGAGSNVTLDGKKLLPSVQRPLGVSMIIRGDSAPEGFYLFDYAPELSGTYSWIFTIGRDIYNVGLWLKSGKSSIRERFQDFCREKVGLVCGEYSVISGERYAVMGIGEPVLSPEKKIHILGDASNTSSASDGEGISRAVISAARFAEKYQEKK